MRHLLIRAAHDRLPPRYKVNPFSNQAMDALLKEYRSFFVDGWDDPDSLVPIMLSVLSASDRQALSKMERETLRTAMKAIPIRSRRSKNRSG
jgi:hypothetical protein